MTLQEKKCTLERYRHAVQRELWLRDELAEWRARAEAASPSLRETPAAPADGVAPFVRPLEHVLVLEDLLRAQIEEAAALRLALDAAIRAVDDPTLRELLYLRYVNGLTWERIAGKMHYCIMQLSRLHNAALEAAALADGLPDKNVMECDGANVLS